MFINSNANRAVMRLARTFLLVLFGLQAAACATSEVSRNDRALGAAALASDEDTAKLQEGMDLFRRADYPQALAVFEDLSRTAKNERVRRKALYAQGCTKLITAQTAEEYAAALALWQSWSRLAPPCDDEDPRMLSSILERISPTLPLESKGASAVQASKPKKKPGSIYVNKDLASYKNMVENKEKELDRVKSRLDSKEREVRRLKQQIESLEAIHLKFQERQKEISTP
ncbi:MAG: hypothetical protein AB9873_10345 [Syntrophobacteraceae bacterium]